MFSLIGLADILSSLTSSFALTFIVSMATYKTDHESFVSNAQGTSVGCVFACMVHAPALIVLLKMSQGHGSPHVLRDYALLVIPIFLSTTVFADWNYWTVAALYISLIALWLARSKHNLILSHMESNPNTEDTSTQISTSYLTLFKGNTLYCCVCYLLRN